jgi:alginate O-acetyltransferase complex protein AlgI
MLFNSHEFLFIFVPLVWFLFYLSNQFGFIKKNHILLFSSIFFYSYWIPNYIFLVFFIILINFNFGKSLIKQKNNKLLIFAIVINVLILLIFKYSVFILSNLNFLFNLNFTYPNIPYPLAISFITFQNIIYLIDCYDDQIKKIKFNRYALFVLFFPQLIAGPITRYSNMQLQFNKKFNNINYESLTKGFFLISIGLFKKIIIADKLAVFVNENYNSIYNLNFFETWFTSIAFTLQFYFDFSGYADIAVGLGLLFFIKIPINFNSPLKATSMIEFWQRWHLTLTSFLTNYIYLPIIKNFKEISMRNIAVSTTITFFVAGLWHGPSWNFILFGLWNGILIIINQMIKKTNFNCNKLIKFIVTFTCINIGFIFFRSENLNDAFHLIISLFNFSSLINIDFNFLFNYILSKKLTFLILFSGFFIIFLKKNSNQYIENFRPKFKFLIAIVLMFVISTLNLGSPNEFIYFKF